MFSIERVEINNNLQMLKQVQSIVGKSPGVKAKAIAAQLGVDRTSINQLLHKYPEIFLKDDEFGWSLLNQGELRVELGDHRWLTASHFESSLLGAGSPLDSSCSAVKFIASADCNMLLEALARLLALCNQLVVAKKRVTLDLSACKKTSSYFDRIGFFNRLDKKVEVLPRRPLRSKAVTYEGNNDGVVELRVIHPATPDQRIPDLLRKSFVSFAGEKYYVPAFTVLSELFGNVEEHSGANTAGFAGLQFYKGGNHLQTVISDNGLGIIGTLSPVLEEKYPQIFKRVSESGQHFGVALLREVFSDGKISQVDDKGRGLGLKRSGDLAQKFNAKISVRQEDFEFRVTHTHAGVSFTHKLNLARLAGTHICFDFKLD
jgi:hypothetical protein